MNNGIQIYIVTLIYDVESWICVPVDCCRKLDNIRSSQHQSTSCENFDEWHFVVSWQKKNTSRQVTIKFYLQKMYLAGYVCL